MPTYETVRYSNTAVYTRYLEKKAAFEADEDNAISFGSAFYKGAQIEGGCDDWTTFLQTRVILPFDNVFWAGLHAKISYYDYDTRETHTVESNCRRSDIITRIVDALYAGSSAFEHCDAHSWRVFTCNSRRVLCLDCKESCSTTEACPGRSFTMNPCETDCENRVMHAVNIKFNYAFEPQHPRFGVNAMNATVVTKNSMVVRANLTKPGIAHCRAFVASMGVELVSLPQLQEEPMNGYGYLLPSASGYENMYIDIPIYGLGPDTLYDVYCYTLDYLSHIMPLEEAVNASIQVQTPCCRGVDFEYDSFPRIADVISATEDSKFMFTVNAQPTAPLTITLSLASFPCDSSLGISTSKYRDLTRASPSAFVFDAESDSLDGKFTVLGYQGCYVLSAESFSEGGADTYNTTYAEVTIIDQRVIAPSAPGLDSVAFNSNGDKLLFSFDSATSEPIFLNASVFACSYIAEFPGAAESMCRWASNNLLTATLTTISTLGLPEVGSVAVLKGDYVFPMCPDDTDCTDYPHVGTVNTTVSAPASAIQPTVVLSSAKTIGSCDDILLDATASTGHGGRPWTSVLWTVTDRSTPFNATLTDPIALYLNENNTDTPAVTPTPYGTEKRVTVLNELLVPGLKYAFSVELTNFLGESGIAEVEITVDIYANTPALSISQASPVLKYRYEEISLRAVAKISTCAGEVAKQGLTYTWKIYLGSAYLTEVINESRDPRVWKISPFTLESNTEYTVQVTAVGYSADGVQPPISTAYVLLQVGQSGLYAALEGGASQTVSRSATIVLDGSGSYDLDASADSPSVLFYRFTCIMYSPDYGDECEGFAGGGWQQADPYLTIASYSMLSGRTYEITMTVTNDPDMSVTASTASATKLIEIINIDVPTVELGSVATKYNVQDKVTINGIVTAVDDPVIAKWYSASYLGVDENGVDIAIEDISLTPQSYDLVDGTSIVQLSLRKGILLEGLSYTFELRARYSTVLSNEKAIASVTIVMNEAPTGGSLAVSPTTGDALNTTFFFQTSGWTDDPDDYPLSYVFSYYVSRPFSQMVVKTASELTYGEATMGQGKTGSGAVYCVANATDSYGATGTTTNSDIRVFPIENLEDLSNIATDAMAQALVDDDATALNNVVTAVTSSLNAANCSSVPVECTEYNREDCDPIGGTDFTCGPCLTGFVGIAGDSNTACGSLSTDETRKMKRRLGSVRDTELTRIRWRKEAVFTSGGTTRIGTRSNGERRRLLTLLNEEEQEVHRRYRRRLDAASIVVLSTGDTCDSASTTEVCASGSCSAVSNFTVDGSTTFNYECVEANKACPNDCSSNGVCVYVDVNNLPLDSCELSSIFCRSRCECESGFYGRDCSIEGEGALASVQDLRDTVCTNLEAAASIQEMSSDVMYARILSIANALTDPSQLTGTGIVACSGLLADSLEDYPALGGDEVISPLVSTAASNLLEMREELMNVNDVNVYEDIVATLNALSVGVQADLAIGETPRGFVGGNLRVLTWLDGQNEFESARYDVPRTDYEILQSTPDESVRLDTTGVNFNGTSTGLLVAVSVTVMTNNPFAVPSNASILQVRTSLYSGTTSTADNTRRRTRRLAGMLSMGTMGGLDEVRWAHLSSRTRKQVAGAGDYLRQNLNGGLLLSRVRPHSIPRNSSGDPSPTAPRILQDSNTSSNSIAAIDEDDSSGLLFPDSDIGTTVTLQNQYAVTYNVVPVSFVGVQCRREDFVSPYNVTVTCPTGHSMNVTCTGLKTLVNVSCPSYRDQPFCKMLSIAQPELGLEAAFEDNPLCSTKAYTDTTTKCECLASTAVYDTADNSTSTRRRRLSGRAAAFPSSGRLERRRRLSSSSSEDTTQAFVSTMGVVRTGFVEVYTQPPEVLFPQNNLVIQLVSGAVIAFYVFFLLFLAMWDKREIAHSRLARLTKDKKARTVDSLLDKIVPNEFRSGRWYRLLATRVFLEHTWLSLVAPYHRDREYRSLKLSLLFNHVLIVLAFNTAIVRYYFADDGTCETLLNGESCVGQVAQGGLRTTCTWRTDNDSCEFTTPPLDIINLILPVFIIAVLVVPLSTLLDVLATWLFGHKQSLVMKKVEWNELKNVKAVVPGSDGLEEYHARSDELQDVQTRRTKFLHAARYRRMQEVTDLVNPMTEAERLTDIIKEKLEADPVIDLTSAVPGKPETEPMSLMDSPSSLRVTVKAKDRYKAMQGVGYRNQSRLAVELYNSRNGEETKDAGVDMGPSSLDRIQGSPQAMRTKPLPPIPRGTPPPSAQAAVVDEGEGEGEGGGENPLDLRPSLGHSEHTDHENGKSADAAGSVAEGEVETVTATASVGDEESSNVHATTRDSDDLDSEEAELAAHEAMKATDSTAQSLLLPPPSAKKSWWTRCFGAHKPKPRILGKILQARVLAMGMKGELQLLEEDEEKEVLLIKYFVLEQLTGYKRRIVQRYLLGEGRFMSMRPSSKAARATKWYAASVMLPLLWATLMYSIYLFHLSLASRSSLIWMVISILALAVDFAFLQPGRIWLKWVVINGTVGEDVRTILHALRLRFIAILRRDQGVMRDRHSLVQHFNPACRAARQFPHLPVSRYLMALNDSDTPYVLQKPGGALQKKRSWLQFIMHFISTALPLILLVWLTALPSVLQDAVVHLVIVLVFFAFAFVLYGTSLLDVSLPIIILLGLVGALLTREILIMRAKYNAHMKMVLAKEKEAEELKLRQLYGTSEGLEDAHREDGSMSVASYRTHKKPSYSPSLAGARGAGVTRVVPIDGSLEDQGSTYDDGGLYDEEAGGGITDDMDSEHVDIIGSFVKEMNSVVTFRSKFKVKEGEFHRSPVHGQEYQEALHGGLDGDESFASTIGSTSIQSSLLTHGRDKHRMTPLTSMNIPTLYGGGDGEGSVVGGASPIALFEGDMTLHRGSPKNAAALTIHDFDSDSQYSSTSSVSIRDGRKIRLAPLNNSGQGQGQGKGQGRGQKQSQNAVFTNPHHAHYMTQRQAHAASSISGGDGSLSDTGSVSSITESIKAVEVNIANNIEGMLAAAVSSGEANRNKRQKRKKKLRALPGSDAEYAPRGFILDSIADNDSRPPQPQILTTTTCSP
jgi:hypothetical protein